MNLKCRVLCRNRRRATYTPTEPPMIATANIFFSGMRHFPFLALCLSRAQMRNPVTLIMAIKEYIAIKNMFRTLNMIFIKLYFYSQINVNSKAACFPYPILVTMWIQTFTINLLKIATFNILYPVSTVSVKLILLYRKTYIFFDSSLFLGEHISAYKRTSFMDTWIQILIVLDMTCFELYPFCIQSVSTWIQYL
jgi:hypothetical protein